jgi:hypothetical protein
MHEQRRHRAKRLARAFLRKSWFCFVALPLSHPGLRNSYEKISSIREIRPFYFMNGFT